MSHDRIYIASSHHLTLTSQLPPPSRGERIRRIARLMRLRANPPPKDEA